tara:strand:- start:12587 stop:13963 length:1377 start_codon:yes stop_codon:yes gene_type:complete
MYLSTRRRRNTSSDYWPGFVDVLSSLLLVMIFLLVVYMLAQHFLQRTIYGQSEALNDLNIQISELSEMLAFERQENSKLQIQLSKISLDLETTLASNSSLRTQVEDLMQENTKLTSSLENLRIESEDSITKLKSSLSSEEENARFLLADIERLKRDVLALETVRNELQNEVFTLHSNLTSKKSEIDALEIGFKNERDLSKKLKAELSDQSELTLLAQETLTKRDIQLEELHNLYLNSENKLSEKTKLSEKQNSQINALNQQILALRNQLKELEYILRESELKSAEQEVVIADLGKRLNLALAAKIEELAEYRSEFFGKLKDVLADRQDFSIIGDRFVFQSEVLFQSGKADLNDKGKQRLSIFSNALKEVIPRIPNELPWILQIDGHTDKRPIKTLKFPSNWELSSARAISVVNFLIKSGIPSHRLSATGYGEFQPIDNKDDEIAYRRNRRIELKLTQR